MRQFKRRPASQLEEFREVLFSMNSDSIVIKAWGLTFKKKPIVLDPEVHFPMGIYDDDKNHIIIDEDGEIVAIVVRNLYGDDVRQYIDEVCEDCVKYRIPGKRGRMKQGGGVWTGIGYTTTLAKGKITWFFFNTPPFCSIQPSRKLI